MRRLLPAILILVCITPLLAGEIDEALRKELLAMMQLDQKARVDLMQELGKSGHTFGTFKELTPKTAPPAVTEKAAQLAEVDRKHRERLKQIIEKHGWPGRSLAGADGANAAWLIAQHADGDLPFQKQCLALIQKAKPGEVESSHLAYLTDRVLVAENKKQRYGTQMGNDFVPRPIEDEKNVDERRRLVGLPPLAEYLAMAKEAYQRASATGSTFLPPTYEIRRAAGPIQIDGKLDEPAWLAAPSVGGFVFPWWKEGKKEQTVAKLLWDDENLYIAHICEDGHITAQHADHDGKIPEDDCFEIMFAPNSEKPEVYYNIEWNVIGGYVDNHRPNGPKQPRAPVWDAEGVRIAGRAFGTLNDDSDTDSHWICEVAIPFKNFAALTGKPAPRPGDFWFANLNRHGGKTNVQYGQWSPGDTPAPAFHTPHRFGKLIFSKKTSPFDDSK